jgi:hypothetical protein
MAFILTGIHPVSAPNGGSARDYLLGFAWSGTPLWPKLASGLSVCLFIGALGANFRIWPPAERFPAEFTFARAWKIR